MSRARWPSVTDGWAVFDFWRAWQLDPKRRKKKAGEGLDADVPEQDVQAAISEVQENIDKELRVKLDRILLSFLEKICSDGAHAAERAALALHSRCGV